MKYRVDRDARKLNYFVAAGFILIGGFTLYEVITGEHIAKLFLLIWSVGAVYVVHDMLKQPTRIELHENSNRILFTNIFKELAFDVSSLNEIAVDGHGLSFKFESKKVSMPSQITGLYLLITKLKKIKPDIDVKGI